MLPGDLSIDVGEIVLPLSADTIYLYVKQLQPIGPWPYSYGLVSWKTANGRELGTVKVYGHNEGEVYAIRVGLPPLQRTGSLLFEPRHYNLRWLQSAGKEWRLEFMYKTSGPNIGNGGEAFGNGWTGVYATEQGGNIGEIVNNGLINLVF